MRYFALPQLVSFSLKIFFRLWLNNSSLHSCLRRSVIFNYSKSSYLLNSTHSSLLFVSICVNTESGSSIFSFDWIDKMDRVSVYNIYAFELNYLRLSVQFSGIWFEPLGTKRFWNLVENLIRLESHNNNAFIHSAFIFYLQKGFIAMLSTCSHNSAKRFNWCIMPLYLRINIYQLLFRELFALHSGLNLFCRYHSPYTRLNYFSL